MNEIELIFTELHGLKDLYNLSAANKNFFRENIFPAVYVWGWRDGEKTFHPYYVGQTTNFYWRTWAHIRNLAGGSYTIFTKEYLISGEYSNKKTQHIDQRVYVPGSIHELQNFFSPEIQMHVKWLVENFTICWANTSSVSRHNREIEKFLAERIGKEKIGATVNGRHKSHEYNIVIKGNEEIKRLFSDNTK